MSYASLKTWDNSFTSLAPDGVAEAFATDHIAPLCPSLYATAMQAISAFRRGDVKQAKRLTAISGPEFGSSQEYHIWAQFKALFLKSPLFGAEHNKRCEKAALDSFLAAESACKRANKRLAFYARHPDRENPVYRVVLTRARELISKVLGNFSERTLEQILDMSRPGGGNCIGTRDRACTSLPWKLSHKTDLCTLAASLPYAKMLVELAPRWLALHADVTWESRDRVSYSITYTVTNYNRVAFVPKDAGVHRAIATEPHLTSCLQLGTFEYMHRRMKPWGMDLTSQLHNQRLALKGSLGWEEADPIVTLDLAQASDSNAVEVVKRLIRSDWLAWLGEIRSPAYRLHGKPPVDYQKWSSMGSGVTFPLETLIFWGIGKACASLTGHESLVSVYGDDIICRRGNAALFIEVLRYCGFKVNTEKSFLFGPFRESCGEDWWAGDRVVPIYIRDTPKLRPTDIYRLMNTLPAKFKTAGVVRSLLLGHGDRPFLMGFKTRDSTACLWSSDKTALKKAGMIRWVPEVQAWEQRHATWVPKVRDVGARVGYAAALHGNRGTTDDPRFAAKASLRREGKWSLRKVIAG